MIKIKDSIIPAVGAFFDKAAWLFDKTVNFEVAVKWGVLWIVFVVLLISFDGIWRVKHGKPEYSTKDGIWRKQVGMYR